MNAPPGTMRNRAFIAVALAVLIAAAGYTAFRRAEARQREATASREAALRSALSELRDAIRGFHAENDRYPKSLDELVPGQLDAIPVDPMTGSASTWRTTTEETVVPSSDFAIEGVVESDVYVVDVQSGAGPPWSDY